MPSLAFPSSTRFIGWVCLLLVFLVFVRSPTTNFVFDEQEALLANPYLMGDVPWWRLFSVDFWGRAPDQTIGSYRPLPNFIWRFCAWTLRSHTPFYLHLVNVVLHAFVATRLGSLARRWSGDASVGWMTALSFAVLAVSTEVVCGVVGLADILAGLFCVLLLEASLLAEWKRRSLGVLGACALGLLSKETFVSVLPWAPLVAWLFGAGAPAARRALEVLALETLALFGYFLLRRAFFAVEVAPLSEDVHEWFPRLLHMLRQPSFPIDPLNNPLVNEPLAVRLPTALGIYGSGLLSCFFPIGLSGDYSYAQELASSWSPRAFGGALLVVISCGLGVFSILKSRARGADPERARRWKLWGLGVSWIPLVFLPVSNAFVLLPTIRADRLWYLPAFGLAWVLGLLFRAALEGGRRAPWIWGLAAVFFTTQIFFARLHAFDYRDDLHFWRATVEAAPKSAKAHLNYGVMLGARGHLEARLVSTRRALELAPDWPMAHVYLGDVLCRQRQLDEAWRSYAAGFTLAPNQRGLVALALQCLWDSGEYPRFAPALDELARSLPGTWVSYLSRQLADSGAEHAGLEKKYRPRAYNERATATASENHER